MLELFLVVACRGFDGGQEGSRELGGIWAGFGALSVLSEGSGFRVQGVQGVQGLGGLGFRV